MQEDQINDVESAHKSNKRNSGIFSFLKWFQPSSTSRESVNVTSTNNSLSGSSESLQSAASNGTVASFSYLPPASYTIPAYLEKCISAGPETDTYKARLKELDSRRETDKNITLRKKYNLFFNKGDIRKEDTVHICEKEVCNEQVSCKSLPVMTRKKTTEYIDNEKYKGGHRRTNSDSSKNRKSGAYLHVKGKRKAPQPPMTTCVNDNQRNTFSLKRNSHTKKRLAPTPPSISIALTSDLDLFTNENNNRNKKKNTLTDITDNIFNDSINIDRGVLKQTKDENRPTSSSSTSNNLNDTPACINSSVEQPKPTNILSSVSQKPWYKRNSISKNKIINNEDNKCELFAKLSNTKNDKKNDKSRLGLSYLSNISELDKEAAEILSKKELIQETQETMNAMPEFIGASNNFLGQPDLNISGNQQNFKRKTARDLIVKFDAITNGTKVKTNSSLFGNANNQQKQSRWYNFNRTSNVNSTEKNITSQDNDKNKKILKCNANPLMKSESSCTFKCDSDILPKEEDRINKLNRKTPWHCQKCQLENDYWRIICYKCSTMKLYFENVMISDDNVNKRTTEINTIVNNNNTSKLAAADTGEIPLDLEIVPGKLLERSKTVIDFSIHANRKENLNIKAATSSNCVPSSTDRIKKDEREKLKKMLIEMKNSLPKRKNISVNLDRKSASPESSINKTGHELKLDTEAKLVLKANENEQQLLPDTQKTVEVILVTSQTVYENIKVKISSPNQHIKPLKISTSAQTNAVVRKPLPISIQQLIPSSKSVDVFSTSNQKIHLKDSDDDGNKKYLNSTQHISNSIPSNLKPTKEVFIHVPKRESSTLFDETVKSETLEVNILLRKLETAIARGDLTQAPEYARDLAYLKVNCSVVRQKQIPPAEEKDSKKEKEFTIDMFVEDRLSHRGPFSIQVRADLTVLQLKQLVAKDFEIPVAVQKWILGKELAANDNNTLQDYQISNGCVVFLYLVAAGPSPAESKTIENVQIEEAKQVINSEAGNILKTTILEYRNHESEKEQPNDATKLQHNMPEGSAINKNQIENDSLSTSTEPTRNEVILLNKKQNNSDINIVPNETVIKGQYIGTSNDKINISSHEKPILPISQKQHPRPNKKDNNLPMKAEGKPATKENEWVCLICTLLNPITTKICRVCANIRPSNPVSTNHVGIHEGGKERGVGSSKLHYQELINLDKTDLVPNTASFECLICLQEIKNRAGVILRECLHQFCKICLANAVKFCDDAEVKCPFRDEKYACNMVLQTREIRALVTKPVYDQFLAKSIRQAENKSQKSYHCKTPDCEGWCLYEDSVNQFRCPVCKKTNCLTCQAIHDGIDCRQYQNGLLVASVDNEETCRTRVMLNDMVRAGDALHCPSCRVVLMKKWGCDWVRCTVCKTEICWVTKGTRWGPGGKGDTSGGCKCGVNGVKCHPQCSYCH